MDFELSEDEKMYKSAIEEMTKKHIEPLLASYPSTEALPSEGCLKLMRLFQPMGILGCRIPEKDGGSGLGLIKAGIFAEAVPYEATDLLLTTDVTLTRIYAAGSDELKQRLLPSLLSGEKIAASATSEPDAGSDVRAIKASAKLVDNEYIINGLKIWSSGASIADIMMVMCNTGKDKKGKTTITPFIVERETSPFEARTLNLMGLNQTHLSEVTLDDCHLPRSNILAGASEHGLRLLNKTWLSQRVLIALCSVGLAQRALNESISYAKQRKQFGKPIGGFQLVQEMLVEMATLVEAGRLLCYKALDMIGKGTWCPKESSMAKYFACESSLRVTTLAVEVFGAAGISKDVPVEKYYRDARVLTFADGTIGIQKLIVGRELTGLSAVR